MNDYPPRVTLSDDGVYRWSYDMDLWRNRFMLRLILKVLFILCAILYGSMLAMIGFDRITPLRAGLLLLLPSGLFALTLLIYVICALAMRGTYRLRYEMDEKSIAIIYSPAAKRRNSVLAAAAATAGRASGNRRRARRVGAMLASLDDVGKTFFSEISRARAYPDCDVINLYEWLTMNQIYVSRADYAFVQDFILDHLPEKARRRSGGRP